MGSSNNTTGILQHRGTFAFLISEEEGKKDVFVRGPSLRLAMDGDRVEVRLRRGGGRPEGEIVRVLEHSKSTVVGILRHTRGKYWLEPRDHEDTPWWEVISFDSVKPAVERLAAARITAWPGPKGGGSCVVTENLGRPGDPGVRTHAIIRSLEIRERFPEPVLREARNFPDQVQEPMWRGRLDLRQATIFTIDGADAKDFDDAVSLEKTGNAGLRLGVHIADVSHYVRVGTELDHEASARGTSVYLPGRVIPMLPPSLSDNLCSLMPGVDRLAFSCFMDIDEAGNVTGRRFAKSVIRSCRRFTYQEVETLLQGKPVAGVSERIVETVRSMGRLAKRLTVRRMRRGALDIDLPEFKIEVAPSGAPTGVVRQERLDSNRLIEEFMILANETVAQHLIARRRFFPSRVHDDPDPEKLATLQEDLRRLGVSVGGNLAAGGSQGVADLLLKIADHPLRDVLGVMVMRSLKQAIYSAVASGHFGLASKAYCHFTSPIRRYPDLVVHRALEESLLEQPGPQAKGRGRGRGRKGNQGPQGEQASAIVKISAHCSERERAAADAERKVSKVLRAELLAKQIGREYSGVVMRSASQGVFVELLDNGAHAFALGAKTQVGTKVRVKIKSVSADKGEVEAMILGAALGSAPEKPSRRSGRPEAGGSRHAKGAKGSRRSSGRSRSGRRRKSHASR